MDITIIWDNPTRSLIDRGEFGRAISFKRKLGFKPATLSRAIELYMPDKISMSWKRRLEAAINPQFQMNKRALIYYSGFKGAEKSRFVVSARNCKHFSNEVANGILSIRAKVAGKLHIDSINIPQLLK